MRERALTDSIDRVGSLGPLELGTLFRRGVAPSRVVRPPGGCDAAVTRSSDTPRHGFTVFSGASVWLFSLLADRRFIDACSRLHAGREDAYRPAEDQLHIRLNCNRRKT